MSPRDHSRSPPEVVAWPGVPNVVLNCRYQLLPLPIRWGARKIDHPRHSDRQSEGSPDGRRLPARVEALRGLRDSRWLDARLLTDALELIEGQPAGFGGQRPVARAACRRETENLAYLLVPVSPLGHHYRSYGGHFPRATVPSAVNCSAPLDVGRTKPTAKQPV